MNLLSPWHILLILVVALLLFGNRLPEVARSLGRALNEFKRGLKDVNADVHDDPAPSNPRPTPRQELNPPRGADVTREPAATPDKDKEEAVR